MTTQNLARIVTDLPVEDQALISPRWDSHIFLADVVLLCAELEAEAGADLADITSRVAAYSEAIDRGRVTDIRGKYLDDLWGITPEELQRRVEDAKRDQAAEMALSYTVADDFQTAVAKAAGEALAGQADAVVTSLRKRFDAQVKILKSAADQGITKDTDPSDLAINGAPKAIEAYRAVGPAVAELNRIAGVRIRMTNVLRYGPREPVVAMFLTGAKDNTTLQGAWNRWAGETETVQRNMEHLGSYLTKVPMARLGGPWLDLIHGGYGLHLNTASETEAVIENARKGA